MPTTMTPMMTQWRVVRDKHPDGIVFFRMGDFFEFFHDDAKKAARLLGLTLTARSKGDSAVPMAGIPVKSAESYIGRLVKLGEKVVICDQVEDPADAKGLVDRQVTRIVTPGTLTEDDVLDEKDNNFLVALDHRGEQCALAWVDLSTGLFVTRRIAMDRCVEEIQALDPAECLVSEGFRHEDPRGGQFVASVGCTVTARPDWSFDSDSAARALNTHFGTKSLEGFGIEGDHPVGAAGAILEYLQETQIGSVGQMCNIRVLSAGSSMMLDRATRSSLELVRTLRAGERAGSLLDVMDRTATAMGARLLKSWVLSPLIDPDGIRARHAAVGELVEDRELLHELHGSLGTVLDMERLAGRIGCDRATPRDLLALKQSLGELPALVRLLQSSVSELLLEMADSIPDLGELAGLLARGLHDDPPATVREGGIIRDGYNGELDDLRSIGREGRGFIAQFQARESEATGIPNLKIGFNKVFGYYIEITNAHKEKVPETYIRKQTLKNAERYITGELKEYEEKVLSADDRLKDLEYELFVGLRRSAAERLGDIQRAAGTIAGLDVIHSFALLARSEGYVRPEISAADELHVEEGCHPVLLKKGTAEPFVPNDVDLDEDRRIMLITGPNMAGKSTYIRQVALITLMAQMGSFVPARVARLGVVDRVFTRVGASDDLAQGASTFMVEMLEVSNILNNATARSLVILDEVGRGTSTYDGLSLAWSITEHLASKIGCKTLFATHYHELTEIAANWPCVSNFNVAVREWGDEIIFLHKIVEGSTDKSYGIHVGRLAGLPKEVLDGARLILERLESGRADRLSVSGDSLCDELQMGLFSEPEDPVRSRLKDLDIDSMSPLEALRLLDELKRGEGG